jgi:hypothetical protein
LAGASLAGADLSGAELQGARLVGAELVGGLLRRADLRGAWLWHANLRGADLEEARLQGAFSWHVDLAEANLRRADLAGTVVSSADLRGADLTGANLAGADFGNADLRGANLTEANLVSAHLYDACCDEHTLCPGGFDPLKRRMKRIGGFLSECAPEAITLDEALASEIAKRAVAANGGRPNGIQYAYAAKRDGDGWRVTADPFRDYGPDGSPNFFLSGRCWIEIDGSGRVIRYIVSY